jgi:hypothetical protein
MNTSLQDMKTLEQFCCSLYIPYNCKDEAGIGGQNEARILAILG